ncbi:MAG: nicotinate (nicotinamide) nucleotide adenylyltransferase [Succinivibrionaceae bacterium]|nr:nicotinate (nicotinamide) nucleotide adenylyltransferase [Succinivibrionaceae bacterium]
MYNRAVGIFGGTFDPFHNGHLQLVRSVLKLGILERIYLMPNYIPPHKPQPVADDRDRLAMINLVCAHEQNIFPLDFEIRRKSVSYTFETVSKLSEDERFSNTRITLLIGMDSLINFTSWYHYEQLLQQVNLVVARRSHYDLADLDPCLKSRITGSEIFSPFDAGQILLVDNPSVDLSSSEIRSHKFNSIDNLIPPYIIDYIKQHRIY